MRGRAIPVLLVVALALAGCAGDQIPLGWGVAPDAAGPRPPAPSMRTDAAIDAAGGACMIPQTSCGMCMMAPCGMRCSPAQAAAGPCWGGDLELKTCVGGTWMCEKFGPASSGCPPCPLPSIDARAAADR
jgi:hypothetical protein